MVLAKYDFDINGKTISNLLEQNEFVYFIPEFQRKVAWKSEFNQLLEDINDEFKNNPNAFYYIGSIISFVSDESSYQKQVIDGQQRLTSFVLLFRAYFDFVGDLKKSNKNIEGPTLEDLDREIDMAWDILFKSRMSSGEKDQNILGTSDTGGQKFLDAYIYKKNRQKEVASDYEDTSEQEFIYYQALDFFKKLTAETTVIPKKLELLSKFITYVLTKVKVADVVAEDFKQAFTMFERMNGRGKGLSTTDLFKYLLMAQYSDETIESFRIKSNILLDKWEDIENNVNKTNRANPLLQFLQHHLQAWYWEGKVSESKIIDKARQMFDKYKLDPKDFLDFMEKDSHNWKKIIKSQDVDGDNVLDLQFKSQFISKFTQYIPSLLIAMSEGPREVFEGKLIDRETGIALENDRFKYLDTKEVFSKEVYRKLSSDIVSIAFMYQVTGAGFNGYENALPKIAIALRENKFDAYSNEIQKMVKSQKGGFETLIQDVEYLKENRGVRHFLFHMFEKEVKEGIRKGSYEYVTGNEMYNSETSEEHIIPKVIEKTGSDATENSINKLEEIKPENISSQKYISLVWRLGNLVALWNTTNKSLSDKSPKEKKSAYKNAEEYSAQLIYNNGVTGDGDKQDGESARKFLKSLHHNKIELEDGKFTENHILLREHFILKVFSKKLGVDLKHETFKKSLCKHC